MARSCCEPPLATLTSSFGQKRRLLLAAISCSFAWKITTTQQSSTGLFPVSLFKAGILLELEWEAKAFSANHLRMRFILGYVNLLRPQKSV